MFRILDLPACLLIAVAGLVATDVCATPPYGLNKRPAVGPFLNGKLPAKAVVQTGNWAVVEAFLNLEFDDPTALMPEPRSNRLYVASRQGKIEWFVNDPQTSAKHEFLDLTDVTQGWDDCGLLAFAFHPEFGKPDSPNRGYVYVWYHYSPSPVPGPRRPPVDTPGYNRLSRFTAPDGSQSADRKSEQVLINQFDHNLWHDGSGIFFGRDGFLYIGVSDEGDSFDSFGNSQTIRGEMFAGVLRIDVDRDPARSHPIRRQPRQEEDLPDGFTENNYTANYYVPNDNPFLDPAGGVLEEFWAVGLRNPHRMTQDPETGRIWIGDIGQGKWEEIDVIERGGNYQWVYQEGFHPTVEDGETKPRPADADYLGVEKPPLYEYPHGTEGKCIIGGYVYRGRLFEKELGGKYIFGDNGSGRLWALSWDAPSEPTVEYLGNMPSGVGYTGLSSFGVDQQNEIYLCKMGRPSKIYKLVPAAEIDRKMNITFAAPERLSWMEAFAGLEHEDTLGPMSGCIPYDVNSPLWSDAAVKRRWIAVPSDERIKYSPTGEWSFPDGTVFIKHFDLVTDETTGETERLETRFLVRQSGGGVYGVSYRWRNDMPEAELVANAQTSKITIKTADGERTQTWYYPSPLDCLTCHTPNAGDVLGVKTRQLNGQFKYAASGVTDNQLRTWNYLGLFDPPLDDVALAKLPALVRVDDAAAPLEHRVRSYLDANCSQCHRPNGAAGYFDARFDTPLADQGLIHGRLAKTMDIAGAEVICPGDVSKSALYQRVHITGELQMPPLTRNLVDQDALDVLGDWINSLAPAERQ
jgi:uncharacterized repeat protein (TIGR03806 family)